MLKAIPNPAPTYIHFIHSPFEPQLKVGIVVRLLYIFSPLKQKEGKKLLCV